MKVESLSPYRKSGRGDPCSAMLNHACRQPSLPSLTQLARPFDLRQHLSHFRLMLSLTFCFQILYPPKSQIPNPQSSMQGYSIVLNLPDGSSLCMHVISRNCDDHGMTCRTSICSQQRRLVNLHCRKRISYHSHRYAILLFPGNTSH